MTFQPTQIDFLAYLPETILFGMGMVVLLLELFRKGTSTQHLAMVSLLALAAAGFADLNNLGHGYKGFLGQITSDDFSVAFDLIFLSIGALTILLSMRFLSHRGIQDGEYYVLILFAVGGMMTMAASLDLLMMFIGLEILSIASYIMAGMLRRNTKSNESALKYFVLGAFSTGFLVYGMVMIYGATATLNIREIGVALAQPGATQNPYVWFGLGLLLVGFGFKLSFVPFHMWTPDVYEGAPTAVTAFFAAGPKAAGFAALVRLLLEGLAPLRPEWTTILWVLAALTMTLGNVVAIQQNNIKRMLAYSSIAHAGYMLVAVVVGSHESVSAIVFYIMAYTVMNMGTFAILILVSDKTQERLTFEDFRGFGYVSPLLGAAMFIFMLSQMGIPLTGGFVGKFQIFKAAIDKDFIWLTVIGVLNSVISVYYYLRIVVVMYMQPPTGDSIPSKPMVDAPLAAVVAISLVAVLYLGILPSDWLSFSAQSVSSLLTHF